jgi:hypothetical protein
MEDLRTREFIDRLAANTRGLAGRIAIELFFDGPRRDLGNVPPVLALRFSGERPADDLILGTVRALRAQDRGVIVATEDSTLRREVEEEGGRVIGFGELFRRLQDGKA